MNKYVKALIMAVALAVIGFFWIWLYRYIGGAAYWAALIAFAVYVASGSSPKKLPWMTLGGVLGVIFGLISFMLAMLVFPTYAVISSAVAGAILLLAVGLVSIPKVPEILPMAVVGWACYIGAMARFEWLFLEKAVWANTAALQTFFGVLLSVVMGLLLGALVATPLFGVMTKKVAAGESE